jgi:uncharacterized protein YbjT (DUF2867 family)
MTGTTGVDRAGGEDHGGNGGRVLVTAAAGNVGSEVVRLLAAAGFRVVAAVRNPERTRARFGGLEGDVAFVPFDFTDPATHGEPLAGVDRVFLLRPPALTDVEHDMVPFLRAAREAGVRHVVFVSLLGVERNRFVPHRAIEAAIRDVGLPFTFLRPSFYMQNLSTTHAADIRELDEVLVPAGSARSSFIDARDIAAVAARVLTEPGHQGRAYPLTGAEALDYDQVAAILTEVLGRRIRYTRPTLLRFATAMRRRGHPWGFVLVTVALYVVTRLGMAAQVTDDVPRLLGRPATTFQRFAEDHHAVWERA